MLAVFNSFHVRTKLSTVGKNVREYTRQFRTFIFLSIGLQDPQKRSKSSGNLAVLPFYLRHSLFFELILDFSDFTILNRTVSSPALNRCTSLSFFKQNTSSFYRMLGIATFRRVLAHTVKRCRAVCTARIRRSTHRRLIFVHCFEEVKWTVSLPKNVSGSHEKATSAQLWSPIQFFWTPSRSRNGKKRAQLVLFCLIATEKY